MRRIPIFIALVLLLSVGCATPPEVKQALVAKDQAYAENERLMQQYRELVSNVTARHQLWYRYVQTRLKLNLALQWATTNPKVTGVPDADLTKDDADLLGPEVITAINDIRLKQLPERKDRTGQTVFLAGTEDMTNLVQKLPELIARIEQRVADCSIDVFDRRERLRGIDHSAATGGKLLQAEVLAAPEHDRGSGAIHFEDESRARHQRGYSFRNDSGKAPREAPATRCTGRVAEAKRR